MTDLLFGGGVLKFASAAFQAASSSSTPEPKSFITGEADELLRGGGREPRYARYPYMRGLTVISGSIGCVIQQSYRT